MKNGEVNSMQFERVKSGVPGFDDLVGGGLPRGYCYTVAGGPGSGKTTFALQFIHKGITEHGENGVYVSLDESPNSIRASALSFGMNLEDLEKAGKLVMIDASPIRLEVGRYAVRTPAMLGIPNFNIDSVVGTLHEVVEKIGAKRVAVDSLTSLLMQYSDPFVVRKETLSLIRSISEVEGCTALLLSETVEGEITQFKTEMFLVNGVILLHSIRQDEEKTRAIEVLKIRGVDHSTRMHPFKITDKGIVIYPEERVFSPT